MKFSVAERLLPCLAVPLALLAGCGAPSSMPNGPQTTAQTRAIREPATARAGLYVSVAGSGAAILGYNHKYKQVCTIDSGYASGIFADRAGNLIAANGASNTVTVYRGPQLCGPEYGSFSDPYGQPVILSSRDALHGTIAVGNIFDKSGAPGSISVCTLAGGCTANLTNSNMYEVAGVAVARNGDCWADATNSSGTASLTYFRRCAGAGKSAAGFVNQYYGSIQIDRRGNLVTIDAFNGAIYVYKGCDPRCSLLGGPFALHGTSVYGTLNGNSTMFAAADFETSEVDVYRYSPTGITYRFSLQPGSGTSALLDGVAYSPGA